MSRWLPRQPRLQLDRRTYRQLCQKILERDGWRCQYCGLPANLQVHHITSRGQEGDDREENLVTLCVNCHQDLHLRRLRTGVELL